MKKGSLTGDLARPYILPMASLSLPWESISMSAKDLNASSHAITGSEEVSHPHFAQIALQDVFNFKEYTDNPVEDIPIGTPIALLFIAAALIFLPSIFEGDAGTTEGPNPTPT